MLFEFIGKVHESPAVLQNKFLEYEQKIFYYIGLVVRTLEGQVQMLQVQNLLKVSVFWTVFILRLILDFSILEPMQVLREIQC